MDERSLFAGLHFVLNMTYIITCFYIIDKKKITGQIGVSQMINFWKHPPNLVILSIFCFMEKNYIQGKYGAIPYLGDLTRLFREELLPKSSKNGAETLLAEVKV